MSRIEKALEKAVQLRNSTESQHVNLSNQMIKDRPIAQQAASYKPTEVVKINPSNLYLSTLNNADSVVAEEYRKLKSILVKLTKSGKYNNVIMVTSAIAAEGKSITSLNLAISLAKEFDHTVLLIDADLRKPSIHKYLDIEPGLGLADCLIDDIDPAKAIKHTGIGKLAVITAGRVVQNPLELFTSQKMQNLISEIKHRYQDRYVIIDSPPYLPFAETRSLSQVVDGIIFVVREGLATKENIQEALETLKGSNLLGVVFNEATISSQDCRYTNYYKSDHLSERLSAKDGSSR